MTQDYTNGVIMQEKNIIICKENGDVVYASPFFKTEKNILHRIECSCSNELKSFKQLSDLLDVYIKLDTGEKVEINVNLVDEKEGHYQILECPRNHLIEQLVLISSILKKERYSVQGKLEEMINLVNSAEPERYSMYLKVSQVTFDFGEPFLEFGHKKEFEIHKIPISIDGHHIGEAIASTNDMSNTNIFSSFAEETTKIVQLYIEFEYNQRVKLMSEIAVRDSQDSVVLTDINGNIMYVNQAFTDVSGYYFEEVVGQNPRILNAGVTDKSYYTTMWNMITSGVVWEGRFVNRKKNGSIFEEEVSVSPVRDKMSQKIIGFVGVKKDVTKYTALLKEKRNIDEDREKLELIINNSDSVVFMLNTEESFQIEYVSNNVMNIFGYSPEELYDGSSSFDSYIDTVDKDNVIKDLNKLVWESKDASIKHRYRMVCKDGSSKWVQDASYLVRDMNGHVIHFQAILTDITELIHLEGQVNHSQKMQAIGQLATGIAHEINTPSQFVLDNLIYLQDIMTDLVELCDSDLSDVKAVEELKEEIDYEMIKEEAPLALTQSVGGLERISKIVSAMKNFSHPGAEGYTKTDINTCFDDTIIVTKNTWKYACELTFTPCDNPPRVNCLVDELNQVFLNMIVNAVHAIQEIEGKKDGLIEISTDYNDDYFIIHIKDNGNGISEENKTKIFDPFFTTKEVGVGTGQGLSITYDVVYNKHKGKIEVNSEIGKGTEFIIYVSKELG